MTQEEPDDSAEREQQGPVTSLEVAEGLAADIPVERKVDSLGWRKTEVIEALSGGAMKYLI